MNEYIVWDKVSNCFIDDNVCIFSKGSVAIEDVWATRDVTLHQHIGKTGINGNRIYADSSIVEFEHDIGIDEWKTVRGWFIYSEDVLAYFVIVDKVGHQYFNGRMKNFKIIGTLQENKELLK